MRAPQGDFSPGSQPERIYHAGLFKALFDEGQYGFFFVVQFVSTVIAQPSGRQKIGVSIE
jgi:hypothetical protein